MKILNRNYDENQIRHKYKKVVKIYDIWSWLTERKAADNVVKLAEIKNGEKFLEVACGTGVLFEKFVKRNPDGENVGVDLSPDMLNKAKKRLRKYNNHNFKLLQGNALNLEFENNSFDLAINNFMLDLMPVDYFDKIAGEFYRVLKPGGRLVVSIFSFGEKKINGIWFWIAKRFPDLLTGCRPVEFTQNLINAGFEIEKIVQVSQNTFPAQVIRARKPL